MSPWLFLCRRGLAPGVGQGPVPVIDSLYTYIPRARDANLIPIFDWLPFISGDSTRPHVYPYGSRKYTNRYIARRSLSRIYVLPLPLGLGAPRALWFRVVVRSRSGVVWPLWCAHRMTAGERSCRSGTGMESSRFPGHTQHVGGGLRWAWCVRRCQRRCSWPRRDVLTFLFRELAYYVRFSREVLCQPSDPRSSDVGWMRTRRGARDAHESPAYFISCIPTLGVLLSGRHQMHWTRLRQLAERRRVLTRARSGRHGRRSRSGHPSDMYASVARSARSRAIPRRRRLPVHRASGQKKRAEKTHHSYSCFLHSGTHEAGALGGRVCSGLHPPSSFRPCLLATPAAAKLCLRT